MDPWGRGFLVAAVMHSTPARMTGRVILHSILQESERHVCMRYLSKQKTRVVLM